MPGPGWNPAPIEVTVPVGGPPPPAAKPPPRGIGRETYGKDIYGNPGGVLGPNAPSDGGQQGSPPPPPPPPPTPPTPWFRTNVFTDPRGVKQPDPSVILFDAEAVSPEYLLELEYEDISGIELINMSRSDLIDGQNVIYSPIKQLSYLRNEYNPNNIIAIPSYFYSEFSKYRIDLILRGISFPSFDEDGNLIIEIEDVKEDEIVEVEIDASGTINVVDFS